MKASRWHGRGAAALGLGRDVSPARFEAIISGAVPGTETSLGRIRDGKREHRPGIDITLQAPKSVQQAVSFLADGGWREMIEQTDGGPKRGPGRPVEKPMPDLIPDTPENIMRAVLNTPPKREDEWRYLQDAD